MPELDNTGYLVPDRVVEIAPPSRDLRSLAGSTTLHRWAKPIDSTVLAIEGDRILVSVGEGRSYWIEPSGNFQLESNSIDAPEPDSYPHQTALGKHPDFVNSSYASIWEFPDLNSGQTRVLIYEANCT